MVDFAGINISPDTSKQNLAKFGRQLINNPHLHFRLLIKKIQKVTHDKKETPSIPTTASGCNRTRPLLLPDRHTQLPAKKKQHTAVVNHPSIQKKSHETKPDLFRPFDNNVLISPNPSATQTPSSSSSSCIFSLLLFAAIVGQPSSYLHMVLLEIHVMQKRYLPAGIFGGLTVTPTSSAAALRAKASYLVPRERMLSLYRSSRPNSDFRWLISRQVFTQFGLLEQKCMSTGSRRYSFWVRKPRNRLVLAADLRETGPS